MTSSFLFPCMDLLPLRYKVYSQIMAEIVISNFSSTDRRKKIGKKTKLEKEKRVRRSELENKNEKRKIKEEKKALEIVFFRILFLTVGLFNSTVLFFSFFGRMNPRRALYNLSFWGLAV